MTRDLRFAVIGAGMAGILSAIKLTEAGFDDFTVYEKAAIDEPGPSGCHQHAPPAHLPERLERASVHSHGHSRIRERDTDASDALLRLGEIRPRLRRELRRERHRGTGRRVGRLP